MKCKSTYVQAIDETILWIKLRMCLCAIIHVSEPYKMIVAYEKKLTNQC